MTDPIHARSTFPTSACYFVLVQPGLVAADISATIADYAPRASVIVVQNAAEADQTLKAVQTIHVAFLELAPESDKGWRIAEAVRARGGRLVFIGDEAENLGPGPDWTVLRRPFSTDCVIAALDGRAQARSGSLPKAIRVMMPSEKTQCHAGRHSV